MEAFGVAASALALVGLAAELVGALIQVKRAFRSEAEVLQLANEIAEVELVLKRLSRLPQEIPPGSNPDIDILEDCVLRIELRLKEVQDIVQRRLDSKNFLDKLNMEKRHTTSLKTIQQDFSSIRDRISLQMQALTM